MDSVRLMDFPLFIIFLMTLDVCNLFEWRLIDCISFPTFLFSIIFFKRVQQFIHLVQKTSQIRFFSFLWNPYIHHIIRHTLMSMFSLVELQRERRVSQLQFALKCFLLPHTIFTGISGKGNLNKITILILTNIQIRFTLPPL